MAKTVADHLIERLTEWGVKTIFGFPGDGINGIFEALRTHQDTMRFIQVRHEEAAAFAACGHAKYTGELYVSAYAKLHGLSTISLRYFNVFGPGQNPKSQYGAAVPNIVSLMKAGKQPIVYGDGEQTRDFCHVSNVVHANLLALEGPALHGEVVNIGCGRRVSINMLVSLVNKYLGTAIKPKYEPARPGDVRDSLADITLAGKVLGYQPKTYFEEGLAGLVKK